MDRAALNERLKLWANFLNAIAAAFFIFGVMTPGIALLYRLAPSEAAANEFLIGFAVCVACSAGLHLSGRHILRNVA